MTSSRDLRAIAERMEADPGDVATFAAVDALAQTLSAVLTVPGLDDDLSVSGAALQLSMARDELRAIGAGEETGAPSEVDSEVGPELLAVARAMLEIVVDRLGTEPPGGQPAQHALARARARLCVGEAQQELAERG